MTTQPQLSKRLIEQLTQRQEVDQWETLISQLLKRLEIDESDLEEAKRAYGLLADRIAVKLQIARQDVHIFSQGSMRTQTTISPQYPVKFDLDIVAELSGHKYSAPNPEVMFASFGEALKGNESVTGRPTPKRRCWRLDYPNKRFYFDVTPAVKNQIFGGAQLSVRDPETGWSPSNPEQFAGWFCEWAAKRFPFRTSLIENSLQRRSSVAPIPEGEVGLDDVLRRVVQLMKLHRDTEYRGTSEDKKAIQPISVIIVTLATKAYAHLWSYRRHELTSPIEVALAVVEEMPNHFDSNGPRWIVANPMHKLENFADRWNSDHGARANEFKRWHKKLESDLEALLHQSARTPREEKIRAVFGPAGVEAWKKSNPTAGVLEALSSLGDALAKYTPPGPLPSGGRNTLG
jgi:hypothetical protein